MMDTYIGTNLLLVNIFTPKYFPICKNNRLTPQSVYSIIMISRVLWVLRVSREYGECIQHYQGCATPPPPTLFILLVSNPHSLLCTLPSVVTDSRKEQQQKQLCSIPSDSLDLSDVTLAYNDPRLMSSQNNSVSTQSSVSFNLPVAVWLCGCLAVFLKSCMAAWLHGCMAAWLHGY